MVRCWKIFCTVFVLLIVGGINDFARTDDYDNGSAVIFDNIESSATVDVYAGNCISVAKNLHAFYPLFFIGTKSFCSKTAVILKTERKTSVENIFRNKYLRSLLLKSSVI